MKETENKANKISWLYGLAIFQLTVSLIFIATLIYIASELPTEEFWEGFIGALDNTFYDLNEAERFRLAGIYSVGPFLFSFASIFVILSVKNRTRKLYYTALILLIISALTGIASLAMPPVIVIMLILISLNDSKRYLRKN